MGGVCLDVGVVEEEVEVCDKFRLDCSSAIISFKLKLRYLEI